MKQRDMSQKEVDWKSYEQWYESEYARPLMFSKNQPVAFKDFEYVVVNGSDEPHIGVVQGATFSLVPLRFIRTRGHMHHGWMKWFIAYMAIAGGNYMLYSTVLPLRIFHHVIVSAILLFWILKYGLPATPMVGAFVAMAVSVILSALASDDKRMALEFAWHWLVNGALGLVAIDWFRRADHRTLFKAQFAVTGFIAATCILEFVLYSTRPGGAFFNINLAGGYLAAMAVPAFAHAETSRTGMSKVLLFGLCGAIAITLLLNQSRGALIALGVAAVVYQTLQNTTVKRILATLGAAGAITAAVIVLSTQMGHSAGDIVRLDLWRVAMDLIEQHPLGVGPGLFGQAYQSLGQSGEWRFTGAHNLYFNIGAELGGVGLAAGAASTLIFLYTIAFRKRTARQNASIAALAGIAAHMIFDNFTGQSYAFLVALLVAHVVYEDQPTFSLRRLRWLASAVVVVGAFYLLQFDRAQIAYERSLNNGSYSAALEAALLDPYNRLYQINLSRAGHDGDMTAAYSMEPALANSTNNLLMYGLTNYGRVFK